MNLSPQHLQALYQAYCKTHLLWKRADVNNLKQFKTPSDYDSVFLRKLEKRLRLGQLAEQFVFNQLETCESIELLAENIQIQQNKQTLGELDTLLLINNQPVHLEIIYKFYVYDDRLGDLEIEKWIGPNRKDSLIEKLNKLQEKQLPLLYSQDCKSHLKQLELNSYSFEQNVLFKAQLFVPYHNNVEFKLINKECVCGFYINLSQLEILQNHLFYIPSKLDWFLEPHEQVDWLEFSNFRSESNGFLENNQSPLFWMKTEAGELSKGFLVWW
ncbi:DUF1853 family protein [Psychroserpens sp. AS72]|uniref:DUF1853 family protein n=1 Tax=Psychroserpens sp. AS72 TaxID=3135775 RepID=UPI003177EC08